jgi:WD40 repeat protein
MSEELDLEKAIATIQAGDRLGGQRLLVSILKGNPKNEQAWLWLVRIMPNDEQRKVALERWLKMIPESEPALRLLNQIHSDRDMRTSASPPQQFEAPLQTEPESDITSPAAQHTPLSDRIAQIEAAKGQSKVDEITPDESKPHRLSTEPAEADTNHSGLASNTPSDISLSLRREGSTIRRAWKPEPRSSLSLAQWLIIGLLLLVILASGGWLVWQTYTARQQDLGHQALLSTNAAVNTHSAVLSLQDSASQTPEPLRVTSTETPQPSTTATNLPTLTATATASPTPFPTRVALFSLIGPENAASLVKGTALPGSFLSALALSADGSLLAGASSLGISVWDSRTLEPLRQIFLEDRAEAVAFSPDGAALYFTQAGNVNLSLLFSTGGSDFNTQLAGVVFPNPTVKLFVTPDNTTLVVASFANSGNIRLVDSASGETLVTLDHTGGLLAASLDPITGSLATAGYNDIIQIWDISKRQLQTVLSAHTADVICLAFSPDGALLASASQDGTILVWESENWDLVARLEEHSLPVQALAFSPDHRVLVSADAEDQILVWEPTSGEVLATFNGPAGVKDLAFSVNGAYLALASERAVEIWILPTP